MTTFYIKILKRLKILSFFNFKSIILFNKKKFKIPIIQGIGYANLNISEPWMTDILNIVLPLGDKKFVDVGVNIGQTLLKLKSVSSDIEYIGFEPNVNCIHYVHKLIHENYFQNITIVPVGISSETTLGGLNFYCYSSTDSSASMLYDFRPDQKIVKRDFVPLFDVNKIKKIIDLTDISILKIDVEGAELEVLNSFKDIIFENEPIILIEILPVYNFENNYRLNRQNEIQNLIIETKYSIFRVVKNAEILDDLIEIKEIGIHSDLNQCEYVLIPNSKKEKFIFFLNRWLKNEN
jgi:FkbM family methyltransferase